MITLPCVQCGSGVEFPDMEQPQIMNLVSVSMVVIPHTVKMRCPTCGVETSPFLKDVQGLALVAVPLKQPSALVVPDTSKIILPS